MFLREVVRYKGQHIIDLEKLSGNVEALRDLAPNPEICFMVKANAYGHGLLPIVEFSYNECGIREFGLATLGEALHIRNSFPDMKSELYVFSDVQLSSEGLSEVYLHRRILPVISNMDHLDFVLQNPDFKNFPLVLKFDTGMSRLGLGCSDEILEQVILKLKRASRKCLYHVMSHFACSGLSMTKNSRNILQHERFVEIKKRLQDAGIEIERSSISNSGAIEQSVGLNETHIRPGLMLYGPSSLVEKHHSLSSWNRENISRLETCVIHMLNVSKGTPIGYGATPAPRAGLLAIIALGYGDGLASIYQNAKIYYEGYEGQLVGRINMDMAQVLFDQRIASKIHVGSKIVIFDHESKRFRQFCHEVQTIPYEVFLNITQRVSKTYYFGR